MTDFAKQQSYLLNEAAFYEDKADYYRQMAGLYQCLANKNKERALFYKEHHERENDEHTIR